MNPGYQACYIPQHKGYLARSRKTYDESYPTQKKCELCGAYYNAHMQIHHIDGNYTNNCHINLMKLCKTCHDDIHHNDTIQNPIVMAVSVLA